VEFLLYEGNNGGHSLVLISIKHTKAFCLYICIDASLNDKAHQWGREGGGGETGRCKRGGVYREGREGKEEESECYEENLSMVRGKPK
jgi:hypothetical protein